MNGYDKNLYTASDVESMVQDFIFASDECEDLILTDSPYYDEELCVWCQVAEDSSHVYTLWADESGYINISYAGSK